MDSKLTNGGRIDAATDNSVIPTDALMLLTRWLPLATNDTNIWSSENIFICGWSMDTIFGVNIRTVLFHFWEHPSLAFAALEYKIRCYESLQIIDEFP